MDQDGIVGSRIDGMCTVGAGDLEVGAGDLEEGILPLHSFFLFHWRVTCLSTFGVIAFYAVFC
jgi:hypothetical protein